MELALSAIGTAQKIFLYTFSNDSAIQSFECSARKGVAKGEASVKETWKYDNCSPFQAMPSAIEKGSFPGSVS